MKGNFLVFGATGGVGQELCRLLQSSGGKAIACGRDEGKLAILSSELGTVPLMADVTRSAEVAEAFKTAAAEPGGLQGVAHCVGSLLLKPAHITSDDEWANVLTTNLTSAFYVVREAAKHMQSNGGGSIVLVSTAAAKTGLANHEAIAAAKAGVEGLMLAAAATYAPKKIRVNCVAPGLTETPLTQRITGNEAVAKASLAMHALGRFGKPSDIARAMVWLLDPANDWVTGQVLGVDGGLGSIRPNAAARPTAPANS